LQGCVSRVVGSRRDGRGSLLLSVVNEVTSRAIRTKPDSVEGPTELGLVLGVSGQVAQLVESVSELTLLSVFAAAALLEGSTELGLVTAGVVLRVLLLVLLVLVVHSGSHHGRGVHGHGDEGGHGAVVVHLEVGAGVAGVGGQGGRCRELRLKRSGCRELALQLRCRGLAFVLEHEVQL